MSTVQAPAAQHLLLHDIDWRTYTRLLHVFAEHRSIRLTYDRGALEIMSPMLEHELPADLLGRFVNVLTEELGIEIKAAGSTTLRRRRKRRGLEPDRSWWIANEARVRGKDQLDLKVDPPPDLAIEVDVTHSSLNRMGIYSALGVVEVWRLTHDGLSFHVLQADGTYATAATSHAFPFVAPADLIRFLALRATTGENAVVRQFRDWVRQQLAAGGPSKP
jgi:Uma2 family endonuclease